METLYRPEAAPAKLTADQYAYRLVVQPPADVCTVISEAQRWLAEQYGASRAVTAKPQLVVADFIAREPMENTLLRYMHRVISTQKRFSVTVNNFSGFPPHIIYARIPQLQPFRQLAAAMLPVTGYLQNNGCPKATMHARPFIPVAESLNPAVYERAMFRFSQRSLFAAFEVEGMVLVRRENSVDEFRRVTVFNMA